MLQQSKNLQSIQSMSRKIKRETWVGNLIGLIDVEAVVEGYKGAISTIVRLSLLLSPIFYPHFLPLKPPKHHFRYFLLGLEDVFFFIT